MPPMDREVRKQRPTDPEATQARRRKNAELRASRVETEDVHHKVPETDLQCPACGGAELKQVGAWKESYEWDYIPGRFRRRRHVRETRACTCGQHIVTAPGPDHSVENTRYGDGFRAYLVTSKCADAMPLYRLAKQFARLGIPIPRSTLTDLFHQVARLLSPLSDRLVELVAAADVVQADETPVKMQHPNKKGYVWTFLQGPFLGNPEDPPAQQGAGRHHRHPRHGRAVRGRQADRLPRAQDSALPVAALPRGRDLHRPAGQVRRDQGHRARLQGNHRRQVRRYPRAGVLHDGRHRRRARPRREDGQGRLTEE